MRCKALAIIFLALSLIACMDPNTHRAALLNVEIGKNYLEHGQMELAKQKLVHALELQPKLAEAHSAISYFYETVGDIKEAEMHHDQAIRYGSGKGSFYNNYGTFLCRQGRLQEADNAFNKALKDKKYIRTAEVYENAGICALKQQDVAKAREYFKNAVKHNPKLETIKYE